MKTLALFHVTCVQISFARSSIMHAQRSSLSSRDRLLCDVATRVMHNAQPSLTATRKQNCSARIIPSPLTHLRKLRVGANGIDCRSCVRQSERGDKAQFYVYTSDPERVFLLKEDRFAHTEIRLQLCRLMCGRYFSTITALGVFRLRETRLLVVYSFLSRNDYLK